MQDIRDLRFAVLIDAENIPHKSIKAIMEEIAVHGNPTLKRVYGDWTRQELAGWKPRLLEHALVPVQQHSFTYGKNSTDSNMIIDAMDILYSGRVDGFCIVSSDSDFTRLATRLREAGMRVLGFGERKTPEPFRVACDKFIYIEVLNEKEKAFKKAEKAESEPKKKVPPKSGNAKIPLEIEELIAASVADLGDESGWAFLGEIGNLLIKKRPDFDTRSYGYRSLTPLINSLDRFVVDVRETTSSHIKHVYVRERQAEHE